MQADDGEPVFDNRTFWEQRYQSDPALGSGAGSRGEFAEHKQQLLQRLVDDHAIGSILDVGCGDIEVTRELRFAGSYTGIDLSPTIVARNRNLRPEWQFLEGDFLALARQEPLRADLVIGFDVLIHQHDPGVYRTFVRELVAAANRMAILTGFEAINLRKRMSLNVAFHEPLTTTLASVPGIDIANLGPFRNMHVIQVVRTADPA